MVLAIVIGVVTAWLTVALLVALVIGRAAALGERNHRRMVGSRLVEAAPTPLVELVA